jgi:DNA replication protein DnaC
VVTTNIPLEDIDGRIRSRLEDPELVTKANILAPDYRRPAGDTSLDKVTSLDLLYRYTFANFEMREDEGLKPADLKSLKEAFRAARRFAEHPQGWLVFSGPPSSGKTHLAAAIGHYRRDQGDRVAFTVVPEMLDHLRATFNPESTVRLDRRFEEVRTAPILILDDLGTQATTPWVREKLYQLFNYRYNAELPTVITTADYTKDIDSRLISRMEDRRLCEIHAITAPAYRGGSQKPARPPIRRRK